MVMLVPRSRNTAAQRGCLRIPDMLVGLGEVRRLHRLALSGLFMNVSWLRLCSRIRKFIVMELRGGGMITRVAALERCRLQSLEVPVRQP
jgi:hypothetical protein